MKNFAGFAFAGRVWPGTASLAEARAAFERDRKRRAINQTIHPAPRPLPRVHLVPRGHLVATRALPPPSIDELEPEVLPADVPPHFTLRPAPDDPLLNPYGHQYIAGTSAVVGALAGAAHAALKGDSVLEGLLVGGVVGLLFGEGVRRIPGA